MGERKINIYDIAKEAQVSPATVSRVIGGKVKVSEEKQKRVQEVIDKYHFKPNALAKGLSGEKTHIIGIIVSDIRNPYYSQLYVECEKAAAEYGYTLLLSDSLGENVREKELLEKLAGQSVDAIIQIGGSIDTCEMEQGYMKRLNHIAKRIPVVTSVRQEALDCYSVSVDEVQSVELATQYLLQQGHRHIVFVGGNDSVLATKVKKERFMEMLKEAEIGKKKKYCVQTNGFTVEEGYEVMSRLLENKKNPTAILAVNDVVAMGIYKAIAQAGLQIPKDIAVASFDNTFISKMANPPLTSVDYHYEKFGQVLIQTAVDAIEGKEQQQHKVIPLELKERQSTKPVDKQKDKHRDKQNKKKQK